MNANRIAATDDAAPWARVLVLFGSAPMYGQERGNLEVFHALRPAGVEPLFLTHRRYGPWHVNPALDAAGFRWAPAGYSDLIRRSLDPRIWINNFGGAARGQLDFQRAVRQFRPTHVHVANPLFFLSMLPALYHSDLPVVYRAGDAPPLHNRFWRYVWQLICQRVTLFVANSQYTRQAMIAGGADPAKIELIYSRPPQSPATAADAPSPRIAAGEVRVVYLGQIGAYKGVGTLVEAMIDICRRRSHVGLTLAGDDQTHRGLVAEWKQQIAAAGLEQRIVFAGYVQGSSELLRQHHIHVCPSECVDSLPNTILEAKAAGLPTIATPQGGIPEVVRNGQDGYIVPAGDRSRLAAALLTLIDDAPQRQRLGRAAQQSLETLGATAETFTSRWLEVYRRTAAPEARQAPVAVASH